MNWDDKKSGFPRSKHQLEFDGDADDEYSDDDEGKPSSSGSRALATRVAMPEEKSSCSQQSNPAHSREATSPRSLISRRRKRKTEQVDELMKQRDRLESDLNQLVSENARLREDFQAELSRAVTENSSHGITNESSASSPQHNISQLFSSQHQQLQSTAFDSLLGLDQKPSGRSVDESAQIHPVSVPQVSQAEFIQMFWHHYYLQQQQQTVIAETPVNSALVPGVASEMHDTTQQQQYTAAAVASTVEEALHASQLSTTNRLVAAVPPFFQQSSTVPLASLVKPLSEHSPAYPPPFAAKPCHEDDEDSDSSHSQRRKSKRRK
jgi:hypothetical protein